MKACFLFIFLLCSVTIEAQRLEQYYNWQWKPAEPASARFVAIIEKKDSLWKRTDYYLREKRVQMIGSYIDSSCKVAEGSFKYFHSNGLPESNGSYVNGKKQGLWLRYYSSGMARDSTVYDNGYVTGTTLSWHQNGFLSDSAVYNSDGSGVSVSWFDNGQPAAAGRYNPGYKRNGKWQFFHKNGKPSAMEIYADGKQVNNQYLDEEGNAVADTTTRDKEAVFAGGMKGWQKFVLKQLYFPSQYKIVNADEAIVVVDGVIDEEGNMTDVEVTTSFHRAFDKIAVTALRKSPKWTPAIAHNRKVKYKIRQAVTFQQNAD
jgi:antitoxin component YwqK of YwqJK toxin-antitoxin module